MAGGMSIHHHSSSQIINASEPQYQCTLLLLLPKAFPHGHPAPVWDCNLSHMTPWFMTAWVDPLSSCCRGNVNKQFAIPLSQNFLSFLLPKHCDTLTSFPPPIFLHCFEEQLSYTPGFLHASNCFPSLHKIKKNRMLGSCHFICLPTGQPDRRWPAQWKSGAQQ